MTHREWNTLDLQLSQLIANRAFKREQPEEWLTLVRHLQTRLETTPNRRPRRVSGAGGETHMTSKETVKAYDPQAYSIRRRYGEDGQRTKIVLTREDGRPVEVGYAHTARAAWQQAAEYISPACQEERYARVVEQENARRARPHARQ